MTLKSPLDKVVHTLVNFKNLSAWKYASTSPQICKMKNNVFMAINLEHREEDTAGLAGKHHR